MVPSSLTFSSMGGGTGLMSEKLTLRESPTVIMSKPPASRRRPVGKGGGAGLGSGEGFVFATGRTAETFVAPGFIVAGLGVGFDGMPGTSANFAPEDCG